VAPLEDEDRVIYCLQESFPRSAKGRSFNLCPPARKDLNKSGRFGLRRLISRGGCFYPAVFRQTLLDGACGYLRRPRPKKPRRANTTTTMMTIKSQVGILSPFVG
jgi:hypothetical protein